MTIHKLGPDVQDVSDERKFEQDTQQKILKELRRMNNYLALMTNEPDPPDEEPMNLP